MSDEAEIGIVCRLCGSNEEFREFKTLLSRCQFDGSEIVRYACFFCDVIFGPLRMIDLPFDNLVAEYKALYEVYSEAEATASEVALFERFFSDKQGVYLDFGQGKNETVKVLRRRGYEVYSYDFAVRGEFALTAAQVAAMQFDGIFSHNVIEHFQDPVASFRSMAASLRGGGRMVHETGEYVYATPHTRFHLFFFLGRSVRKLAELAGLEVSEAPGRPPIFTKRIG